MTLCRHAVSLISFIFFSNGHNNQKKVALHQKRTTIMEITARRYPVGIQTFSEIREGGYVYVDKTDLVWKLANSVKYTFLSRPRRFGKSLLTTTLKSYFEGRRDLFEGLKIMDLEQDWKQYPVIHVDMSTCKGQEYAQYLRRAILYNIEGQCKASGVDMRDRTPGQCLAEMIKINAAKTNGKVVVLIDEYDAPLLEVMHEQENLDAMRKVMQEFYQPLKACEAMIRFCFLTGITKFSQLSIFSTLNNIYNISMDMEYATICGITETELTTVLNDDINLLAGKYGCSYEEMHHRLKVRYDGYSFSGKSESVYNPYSLFCCFKRQELSDFWFESGTPTFLLHQMKHFETDITQLDNITASASAFYRPTETLTNALPLLYQAGYLTIKGYDEELEDYRLGIPNQEVRNGLVEGLLPYYCGLEEEDVRQGCAKKMWIALRKGDIDQSLRELKAFLAGVPYVEGFKKNLSEAATKEGFYEYTFYLILSMLNVYVQTQVKCSTGRVDMIVYAKDAIYLFEFKVKSTATQALHQIEAKDYAAQFATDPRKVVKVGVNFDIDTWTIEDWERMDR